MHEENYDSEYEEMKANCNKIKNKKSYNPQNWEELKVIEDTFYENYADSLIRDKIWLFKNEYSTDKYYVLKCDQGLNCQYRQKVEVTKVEKELPAEHPLFELSNSIFDNVTHKLTIYENDKPHSTHWNLTEVNNKFTERIKGCSELAKIIIRKLELYTEKQTKRINILKKFFPTSYDWHVPTSRSLCNLCTYLRKKAFVKGFDNTLGDFKDLAKKHSFEKSRSPSDVIILDMNEDKENFTLVISCQHYLEHFIKQKATRQPQFFSTDATFSIFQNGCKLLAFGINFLYV